MADAVQPYRQDVKQEAPDELVDGDGGGAVTWLALSWFPGLSVAEGDGPAVEGCDAAVRDGDPVGVAGEVAEDLLGPPEGPFRVDHPVLAAGGGEGGVELAGIGEMGDVAVEGDFALPCARASSSRKRRRNRLARTLTGARNVPLPVLHSPLPTSKPALGTTTCRWGVEQQLLIPGMEDGGAADPHAAVARVPGDGAQGLGGGAEQDVEHDPAVAERDGGDLRGQGEDHMEVGHRQDVGGARLAPAVGGETLARGAVAIAAGVVQRMLAPAPFASVHVPAEHGGPARLDRAHDLEPASIEPAGHALSVGAARVAEDLCHAGAFATHAGSAAKHREV